MKRILPKSFLLAAAIIITVAAAPQTVRAGKIGDIVNYVLYSDIVAYIGNRPIQSFNIDGYTAVAVEDLTDYGFDVVWDASARALYASRSNWPDPGQQPSYEPEKIDKNKIGKRETPVFNTDIKCFFDDKPIGSFNIGGETIVRLEDLAKIYGTYVWDADKRTARLDLAAAWRAHVANPAYDESVTEIPDGFVLSLENRSTDESAIFVFGDCSGDHASIESVDLSDGGLSFSVYMNIESYGDFFKALNDGIDIRYGERVAGDTTERREALSSVFRVYVNDEPAGGELAYSQGNGHADYTFLFDRRVGLADIKTMRIELGF